MTGNPTILPGQRIRARGAESNRVGRFEPTDREAFDDGWDMAEEDRLVATEVRLERPRSALTFNRSPDVPFDRSINPYRGCEHGCIYCFARPSHAWLNLSPGLDFETRLIARPGIAGVLDSELRRPAYRVAPVAIGTNTDPYQPIEARYRITREVLELCLEVRHPVIITTKSDRVLADLDLLEQMARLDLVGVGISVTSLDPGLSRLLEPRAASPAKRLDALARLVEAGVPAHVSIAPVIPAITDEYIEAILSASAARGVRSASWIFLRLPHEVAPLFREWLETHFPDRATKVMSIVRAVRGGRDNDPRFGSRMKPQGVWAELYRRRFRLACQRHGIDEERQLPLDCSQFRKPDLSGQLRLL